MLQKEIYNNLFNKKANSIVNEENEYKGLNIEGLDGKQLRIVRKIVDMLNDYNKKEWEKLDKQGKHDMVMKVVKDLKYFV